MTGSSALTIVFRSAAILLCAIPAAASDGRNTKPKFELKDGDRVVFLGNTLIERAQKYGYWETMLTARYPNRKIIFRNLGWDGDTVWAESRGMFDTPEKGYARMLAHVGRIKPTVIFLGYGNNEAFAGEPGLPRFIKQYNKLLDDLARVSAKGVRFVLLSPTRHEKARLTLPDPKQNNAKLQTYGNAIQSLAKKRNAFYVDLFTTVVPKTTTPNSPTQGAIFKSKKLIFGDAEAEFKELYSLLKIDKSITEDGIHLRSRGYRHAAEAIYNQLALRASWDVVLDTDRGVKRSTGTTVGNVKRTKKGLVFSARDNYFLIGTEWFLGEKRRLAVHGLHGARYSLRIDGKRAVGLGIRTTDASTGDLWDLVIVKSWMTRSSKDWAEGVYLTFGPDFDQLEKLRQAIIAKNRLYFYSWRPQNVTYLFLFRKHEQGQNAKEVKEFARLVAEKEKEIDRLKKPATRTYELIRVKPKK